MDEFIQNFTEWVKKSSSYKSKHKVKLRIDTSKTGKSYGKKIPGLEWLYDYVNKCKIKTHELYILVVSIDKKDYIVDYRIAKIDQRYGNNKIAKKMINSFLNSLGPLKKELKKYGRFSFDGAWGNGEILQFFFDIKTQNPVMKSGGNDIVIYEGNEMSLNKLKYKLAMENDFKNFNPCHKLRGEYICRIVELKQSGLKIKVVLRRFLSKNRSHRYLLLLTPNINLHAYQIAQCYEGRWGIEDCIKSCKQVTGVTKYSFHTKGTMRNIELYIALNLICYMIMNWYRVEHCRPSKTSIYKLEKKFGDFFDGISYKAMWHMFSP